MTLLTSLQFQASFYCSSSSKGIRKFSISMF
jgi:hypothetical protein